MTNVPRREKLKRKSAKASVNLRPDQQPADPVVLRLFADLQLAEWTRANNRKRTSGANRLERQALGYLIHYLLTLERPDIRI